MQINHIASGSKGNCIVVGDGHSKLMLDAGLSYSKLSREVRFSEMAGVFITHAHGDHSKAVPELLRRGVKVCMSQGTADGLGFDAGVTIVEHAKQIRVGSWFVMPFDAVHDANEPLGFLFQSRQTGEKGVYLVDSGYVKYDFSGVHYILIEANYSETLLEKSGDKKWLKERIRTNHLSLDDLITFFDTSDMSKAEEIWLLHLSSRNSNEAEFKDTIQRRYGVPVYTISDNKKQVVV